jgi:hypothetical protein
MLMFGVVGRCEAEKRPRCLLDVEFYPASSPFWPVRPLSRSFAALH